jgi:EpsD family peptidyl-prolyl cis-trans isomerase
MGSGKVSIRAGGCVVLACALAGLFACSRHSQTKTQVVAKVNDREITVSQLNQTLASINPETLTPQVTREAIDSLVNEELLLQGAQANKLDRDPATLAAIERARRQILIEAYAQRLLYPKSPVSATEEQTYFKQNPGLFAERKIFDLTIYTVQKADLSDLLKTDLNATHSADQVRAVLEKHQVKYMTQHTTVPSEDLPLGKIAQFSTANVGDLLIADQRDGHSLLVCVNGLEPKPLSFESAKASIDQYLTRKRNAAAVDEHLKTEREAAKISYQGQFAQYYAQGRR